jgi:hypothetical protein
MARARDIALQGPRDLFDSPAAPDASPKPSASRAPAITDAISPHPGSGLWIGEDGFHAKRIQITPRIGISKAADRLLRYILAGNPFVSGENRLSQN